MNWSVVFVYIGKHWKQLLGALVAGYMVASGTNNTAIMDYITNCVMK